MKSFVCFATALLASSSSRATSLTCERIFVFGSYSSSPIEDRMNFEAPAIQDEIGTPSFRLIFESTTL